LTGTTNLSRPGTAPQQMMN